MTPPSTTHRKPTVSNEVLAERLGNVQQDVHNIQGTLETMNDSLRALSSVEDRQADQRASIDRLFLLHQDNAAKIGEIQTLLPGLKELRRWVVGGILAGISLMLIAVAGLVIAPRVVPPQSSVYHDISPRQ